MREGLGVNPRVGPCKLLRYCAAHLRPQHSLRCVNYRSGVLLGVGIRVLGTSFKLIEHAWRRISGSSPKLFADELSRRWVLFARGGPNQHPRAPKFALMLAVPGLPGRAEDAAKRDNEALMMPARLGEKGRRDSPHRRGPDTAFGAAQEVGGGGGMEGRGHGGSISFLRTSKFRPTRLLGSTKPPKSEHQAGEEMGGLGFSGLFRVTLNPQTPIKPPIA